MFIDKYSLTFLFPAGWDNLVVVELLKAEYKIRSQLENVYTRLKIVSRRNLANVFHCFLHKTFQEYLAAAYIPAPEKGEDVDTLAEGSPDLWVDANNELNLFNIFKAPNRVEDNMRLVAGRKPDLLRGNDEVNVIEMFKTLENDDVNSCSQEIPGIGKTTFCLKLAYYWAPKDDSVLKKTFEMEILALGELAWKCLLSEIELEEKMPGIGISCPRPSLQGRKSKEIKTLTRILLSSQDLPRVLGCRVHCREVNQQFNWLVRGRKPDLLRGNDEVNVIEMFKTLENDDVNSCSQEIPGIGKTTFCLKLAYYWAPKDDSVLKKTFEMEILALGELAWKCLLSEIELEEKMRAIGIPCPRTSLRGRKSKEIKTSTRVLLSSQDLPRVLGCRVHCREVNQQFNRLVGGRKPDLLGGNDEVNVIEMFKTLEKGGDVFRLVEGIPGIGKTTFCPNLAYYWAPKDDSALEKTFEKEILVLGELAWKCLLSEIELEEKMPGTGSSCPRPSLQGRKSTEIKASTRVPLSLQDLPRVLDCRVYCREVNQQFNIFEHTSFDDLLMKYHL